MIERRRIRVLTTYSKTNFFVDKGTQVGLTVDAFKLFEDDLNKQLKTKNIRVYVVIIPVANDDLIPALLEGRGDIVAAAKVMTAWRAEQVDFTNPTRKASRRSSSLVGSTAGHDRTGSRRPRSTSGCPTCPRRTSRNSTQSSPRPASRR
jgi:membrane-bound lytic murein transglycosylase MltF